MKRAKKFAFKIGACIDLCLQDPMCKGYTWYGEDEFDPGNRDICVLFKELNRDDSCFHCISGHRQVLEDGG